MSAELASALAKLEALSQPVPSLAEQILREHLSMTEAAALLADRARLEAELKRLRDEAKPGQMPHRCTNPDCTTIRYGEGYKACPSCGGTEGRSARASDAGRYV